jgi:hypothetical protein
LSFYLYEKNQYASRPAFKIAFHLVWSAHPQPHRGTDGIRHVLSAHH